MSLDDWKFKFDEFLYEIWDNPMTGANEIGLCNLFHSRKNNSLLNLRFLGGLRGGPIQSKNSYNLVYFLKRGFIYPQNHFQASRALVYDKK